ncbi:hypothetical protein [Treponema putidum]|nr:hypothetical protein [Treponema putidum]
MKKTKIKMILKQKRLFHTIKKQPRYKHSKAVKAMIAYSPVTTVVTT